MPDTVAIGTVRSVRVIPDQLDAELFTLALTREGGDQQDLHFTREAMRALWSYLTRLLYPEAADQLTGRTETVARKVGGLPEHLTYSVTAYADAADSEFIMVGGFTRANLWTMALTRQTSEDLWTALEDHLNQV